MEFKLKSKLSSTKYPCLTSLDEILKWLTFDPSVDFYLIDPVVLGRAGAMAKDENKKHHIISGHRSSIKQAQIYIARGGVKNKDGSYSDPNHKINGTVAKPNTSDHEIHFAIDSGSQYYKNIETVEHPLKQPKWNKYGLCKPLTKGAGMVKAIENWHLIPVEVYKLPRAKKLELMATEVVKPYTQPIPQPTQQVSTTKPQTPKKPINTISPFQKLHNAKIISDLIFWQSNAQKGRLVDCNSVKWLFRNFYKHMTKVDGDYLTSVNYCLSVGVLNDKSYWIDSCNRGQTTANGEYVEIVIKNMASKLK